MTIRRLVRIGTRLGFAGLVVVALAGCDAMAGKSDHPPARMPPPEAYVPPAGTTITATTTSPNSAPSGATTTGGATTGATTPGSTPSGATPPTTPAVASFNVVGKWTGEPRVARGGGDNSRNVLAAQLESIKKYGSLTLNLTDDGNYTMNLFGFKVEGKYEIKSNYVTLKPETVQGVDLDTAKSKGVNGPDGKHTELGDQMTQNLDLEILVDDKQLLYNQGSGTPEFIYSRG